MSRGGTREGLRTIFGGLRHLLRQRWIKLAAVVCVLLLGVRVGFEHLLARVVSGLAEERGLTCEWADIDLEVLGGRGELSYLELRPQTAPGEDPAEPLLEIEYAVLDLDVWALLSGELQLHRAEIDGLDARVKRDAEGRWNLEQHIAAAEVLALLESEDVPEEEASEEEPAALDLSPPIGIAALRLQHARLHFVDEAVSPPLAYEAELSARLSNLRDPERPVRFSATLTGGELLDGAHVDGGLRWSEDALSMWMRGQAGGLRPQALEAYLGLLGLRSACESLEADGRIEVTLEVHGEARDELRARTTLSDLRLYVDGEESLALDHLEVDVERASAAGTSVPRIEASGLRGVASKEASGALRVAGLEVVGRPGPPATVAGGDSDVLARLFDGLVPGTGPSWAALFLRPGPEAYPWSLGRLSLEDAELRFTDHGVEPAAVLPLLVESFELTGITHDPSAPEHKIPVSARMSAPGLADSITLVGELDPIAPQRELDLALEVQGLALESVEGYLLEAGLQREHTDGSFRLRLRGEAHTDATGRTTAALQLSELALTDSGGASLVRSVALRELELDPAERRLVLGEIEVAGTQLGIARDASNGFLALGFRVLGLIPSAAPAATVPDVAEVSPPPTPAEPAAQEEPPAPPPLPATLELRRLAWTDSSFTFLDGSVEPPRRFGVDELELELTGLVLGGAPDGPEHEPARFLARAVAPGLADELELSGLVRSRPGSIDLSVELGLAGRGLSGAEVAPYLAALGIEPTLTEGRVGGSFELQLAEAEGGWAVSLAARDLALEDAGVRLASLDELRVSGLDTSTGDLRVESISVSRPFLRVERDAGGVLAACGVRLVGGAEAPEARPAEEGSPAALTLPALPNLYIGELVLDGARLAYGDAALEPRLDTEVVLDARVEAFATSGERIPFTAELSLPGALDSLTFGGGLRLGDEELQVEGELMVHGVRGGELARFLPPGLELDCEQGVLRSRLSAFAKPAAAGGLGLGCGAYDFSWGVPEDEPWLSLEHAVLAVDRVDPAAGEVELGGVRAMGVRLDATRRADGSLAVLGLRTVSAPAPVAAPVIAEEPEETPPAAGSTAPPPRVQLVSGIELELEQLRFTDETQGPDARPLICKLSGGVAPATFISADPRDLPPILFGFQGELEGLVGLFGMKAELTPFAEEPALVVSFGADGVRTAALSEFLPELADVVTGELEAGVARGTLRTTLSVRRSRPYDLGLGREFGAEVELTEFEFRAEEDGDVLAGVERILAEIKRIDPQRGEVHVELLEITRPQGRVRRDAAGLHALGLVVAPEPAAEAELPEAEAAETVAAAVTGSAPEAVPAAAEVAAEASEAAETADAPNFRLDRLLVTEIDFQLLDETVDPPLLVPLEQLDAELRRFSTRGWREGKPLSFDAFLSPGAGSLAEPVFQEVVASGRVSARPELEGWAQVQLLGLELSPLAGLVPSEDVTIEGGSLEASARVRFRGADGMKIDTTIAFTDLDIDEPEGGPIESALVLPMTLDTALFLLRSPDGEHRFSVPLTLDEDGVGAGDIALAATSAFAQVVVKALAGMPLRMFGALIPGGDAETEPEEVRTLRFASGTSELSAADRRTLAEVEQRLRARRKLVAVLRHELTTADRAYAERIANPSPEECREMTASLRQRKAELLRRREEAALEARALHAVGSDLAEGRTEELRALEVRLAATEAALDRVLDILHSTSARQRAKRTRTACRELSELRLQAAEQHLRTLAPGLASARIEVRKTRQAPVDEAAGGRVAIELRER